MTLDPSTTTHSTLVDTARTAPTRIMLVEDNKIDARLTRHALQQIANWPSAVEVVDDGEKAIRLLCEAAHDRPDLVILDLNLPKYDGTQVLQFIRASQDLQNLLVYIFSSSPVEVAEERVRLANVRADSYFEKPHQVGTYSSIAHKMGEAYRQAKTAGQTAATA